MRYSKLMKERIRRVSVLFRELGVEVLESESSDDSYSAEFESDDGFHGGLFISRESKFLEIGYSFILSPAFSEFVRLRMEHVMQSAYEYGAYMSVVAGEEEINLSLFSKIYYAGLNYFSLKETMRDFREVVDEVQDLFELPGESGDGGYHEDS